MFLIFLYFVGSCTERPADKPASENVTPAYTELTPDEYQKQMDELLKRPPVTQTAFKSPMLSAKALDVVGKLDEWFDKTNLYDVYDFTKGYFDYLKNPDYYPEDDVNIPPPKGKSNADNPVTSTVIPYHYNAYGKERINYNNGVYEIVICRFDADLSVNNQSAKGHATFTRNSSEGYSTSFGFDIKLTNVGTYFSGTSGFVFSYIPLSTNVTGIDITHNDWKGLTVNNSKRASFYSSTSNTIHTINNNTSNIISYRDIVSAVDNSNWYNRFTVSQTISNNYNFTNGLNNYQNDSLTKSVNVYYNNHPMDTVTTNNYNQYSDYGYTYNNITNSLEFDPDVLANYFNNAIKPTLDLNFDDIFSKMPDINATIKNYTGELNNLVEIIQQTTSTSSGTYPVATGEVNVNVSVDVTFPEEFYRKYPALTTEPAFVAENPDIDYAFDEPLPLEILNSAGHVLNIASDFIQDSGLMPMYIMCTSLSLIALFLL